MLFCLFSATAMAQNSKESIQKSAPQATQVLTSYFAIKDALVNDNRSLASSSAEDFVLKLKEIDINTLQEKEKEAFIVLRPKLDKDAGMIAQANKIEDQRYSFAALSLDMWKILMSAGPQQGAIYQQYCPMKKTYWISRESSIKNPYFGKQMLTCGKVTETLK